MTSKIRYYVVLREALGLYGDERGYDSIDDVLEAYKYSDGESLVVIKGVELPVMVQDIKLSMEDTND